MKSLTKNRLIHEGDKVKLLECTEYNPARSNPKIGSKYECAGVVTGFDSGSMTPRGESEAYDIRVRWDNGLDNLYRIRDLEIIDGGYISIWDK